MIPCADRFRYTAWEMQGVDMDEEEEDNEAAAAEEEVDEMEEEEDGEEVNRGEED